MSTIEPPEEVNPNPKDNLPTEKNLSDPSPIESTSPTEGDRPTQENISGRASVLSAPPIAAKGPIILVETAFLASTSSLIWLINYYFPLGPLLRIFFPVPIALVYMRWNLRSAWMAALTSGLLLSVLMGPTRSILFIMPFGLLGVLLGWLWRRRASWNISMLMGTLIGTFGFFFRIWLVSILLGEDLWVYLTSQMTELADLIFLRLGWLAKPNLYIIQGLAVVMVILNNLIYLFAVHLAASVLLERLGNPIPPPPRWVRVLLDEE